jgi:hypothetical protein
VIQWGVHRSQKVKNHCSRETIYRAMGIKHPLLLTIHELEMHETNVTCMNFIRYLMHVQFKSSEIFLGGGRGVSLIKLELYTVFNLFITTFRRLISEACS